MADESDQGATPAENTPESTPATDPAPLGEAGQKALDAFKQRAREAEARLKELEPLAERAREIEEAQKSEVEKTLGKLNKAEQARAEAEAQLRRYEVARERDIPQKLVPLLTATDEEGLNAQADLILENVKAETPDFDGGAREPAPDPKSPAEAHNELAALLFGQPT